MASTAVFTVPWAVNITTGIFGWFFEDLLQDVQAVLRAQIHIQQHGVKFSSFNVSSATSPDAAGCA